MKGGFSIESNETAEAYKNGVCQFTNNEIQSFDPNFNFRSSSTLFTALEMKTKALGEGNLEKNYSKAEMEILAKPSWTNSWTRFPARGF